MKLIDILVQELPDLGGWPPSTESLYQNAKGRLVGTHGCIVNTVDMKLSVVADDTHRSVTRQQYEAALAASKPEWDGEGLPPVGCVCEVRVCNGFEKCEIVFSHPKSGVAFVYLDEENHGGKRPVDCVSPIPAPSYFRPIRSEADKKRAECVIALSRIDPQVVPFEYGGKLSDGSLIGPFWYELYDAIAAGKIPHIRID